MMGCMRGPVTCAGAGYRRRGAQPTGRRAADKQAWGGGIIPSAGQRRLCSTPHTSPACGRRCRRRMRARAKRAAWGRSRSRFAALAPPHPALRATFSREREKGWGASRRDGHLTTARTAKNLSPPPEGRPGMQFLDLVYVDNEMLEALPAGEPDAMMRTCLRHAAELQAEGKLVGFQQLEDAHPATPARRTRKSVVSGKGESGRVKLGG